MVLLVEAVWPVSAHRPVAPIRFCRWAATGAQLASAVHAHFRKAKRARTDRDMIAAEVPPPEPLMSAHTNSTATVPGRGVATLSALADAAGSTTPNMAPVRTARRAARRAPRTRMGWAGARGSVEASGITIASGVVGEQRLDASNGPGRTVHQRLRLERRLVAPPPPPGGASREAAPATEH